MSLPPQQIVSSHDTKLLPEVLRMVMEHRLAWPDFQRIFHWTEAQICKLIPSLLRGVPVPNMVFWKWAAGSGETTDTTTYKSLGCAGYTVVRRPEFGVVDGGHRLNCLCYLLDTQDENGFVPSYRVTKGGVPYKSPDKKKFFFCLPELDKWMRGQGQPQSVVVAFQGESDDIDHLPTRVFFPDDDGTSRMTAFINGIQKDPEDERNGSWLSKWVDLLLAVEKRIAQITLPIRTITCPRKYAIESYLLINTNAQPLTEADLEKAVRAAQKDKTKIFDDLLDHDKWRALKNESSRGHKIFQSRAFQKTLLEHAAVLLYECGLESSGEWWEWGRLTKLGEAEMTKESQIDHADEKYADFAKDNMDIFLKRLVQAYQRSSHVLSIFPAQFFDTVHKKENGLFKLILRTFLAFTLATTADVPSDEKMRKLLVRMLCNIVVDDKSHQSLDCISGPIQMFNGAKGRVGAFDYDRLPEWHVKNTLCSEQVNAWVIVLCVLHPDTAALLNLVLDSDDRDARRKKKMEKHHIFPKGYLLPFGADFNHVNSLYNLMPISDKLNNAIRDLPPHLYLPKVDGALKGSIINVTGSLGTANPMRMQNLLLTALKHYNSRNHRGEPQSKRPRSGGKSDLEEATVAQLDKLKGLESVSNAMHVPTDARLLHPEQFQAFLEQRRRLIIAHLQQNF